MLRSIPKTRPQGLKHARHREASAEADGQFGIFNAQHFMNLFPKVAKIARKRLFTSESNFVLEILFFVADSL